MFTNALSIFQWLENPTFLEKGKVGYKMQ